jgi:UDP-glucuronate 4-epimerase
MPRMLITGASGYVGRQVLRYLLGQGVEVTALGRHDPGQGVPFIQADITKGPSLARALKGKTFDALLHLASLPGDTGDPQQMVRVNINGCENLLECARQAKMGRFVLASSISAYEWYPATKFVPPVCMPVDEEHPCRPRDMYSTTKRAQELLAFTYYHQYGLPVTALRLTAVVGPQGSGGGRGWGEFAAKLAEGVRVQVPHFVAEETCHYVDSRDVARMFLAAATHPGAVGEVFNCVGPAATRGDELRDIVQRVRPGIKVDFGFPWSMAQGGQIAFSMAKAEKLMGFVPQYTMADSIRAIKDWIDAGGLMAAERPKESFGGGVSTAK